MGFWGIEVKPGIPYTYQFDGMPGKLHVTQATLGDGSSKKKCVVQCSVGDKTTVFLCSFLPDKIETCPLNLQFEGNDSVAFSVIGPRSVHLSGFFKADEQNYIEDDYESDSFGEDIAETDSDESSDYDSEDEYECDFIDDDGFGFLPSPVPNSGVVIEEVVEDEKPANAKSKSKKLKKKQVSESNGNNNSQKQIVVKSASAAIVVESEDEDGFPVPSTHNGKPNAETVKADTEEKMPQKATTETKKKRRRDDSDIVESSEGKVANVDSKLESNDIKNKKKQKQQSVEGNTKEDDDVPVVKNEQEKKLTNDKKMDVDPEHVSNGNLSAEKKKKKKKGKTKEGAADADTDTGKAVTSAGDASKSTVALEEKKDKSKASQVRTFPNGLVIEELKMGKPDGKRASPGSKVSVHYIGKLKKNGSIFDSNIGRAPFKFRLGVGQVIKGWDVGVKGMREGDKRRLTIPPDMGYGTQGAGKKIPPNSWLIFEVDLVAVG